MLKHIVEYSENNSILCSCGYFNIPLHGTRSREESEGLAKDHLLAMSQDKAMSLKDAEEESDRKSGAW